MRQVSQAEVEARLAFDNPWWQKGEGVDAEYRDFPKRAYLASFCQLVADREIRRAVVLLGSRRVGKTVMVYQSIQSLLDSGVGGRNTLYLSLETPIYTGLGLEQLVNLFYRRFAHEKSSKLYVFFAEALSRIP
jgi:predicted AAA+ superfamily ATPase